MFVGVRWGAKGLGNCRGPLTSILCQTDDVAKRLERFDGSTDNRPSAREVLMQFERINVLGVVIPAIRHYTNIEMLRVGG